MKENLQKFAIYILIGFLVLGYVMLRAGLKNDNGLFSIIGIILMVFVGIVAIIYFTASNSSIKKQERQQKKELKEFKRKANKILVNLENVEIDSNTWTDHKVVSQSKYGGLDEMAGYGNSNIVQVNRNSNTLKIKIPFKGEQIDYIVNIVKDPTTLAMKLAIQKETYLYVNPKDDKDMYLDLEFLE